MSQNRDDYAIVVGIDRYPGLDHPGLSHPPANADDTARAFAAWLTKPEGGGLPSGNVALLLRNGAAAGVSPGPQLWRIDRALAAIGAGGGGRVGRRLYIAFAGCGWGESLNDLALLTAEAGPGASPPTALSLSRYRWRLRQGVAFRELVFLAELRRIAGQVSVRPPPFPDVPELPSAAAVREFVVVGDAVIRDAIAVLDEASRIGPNWHLEASALASRLRARRRQQGSVQPWLWIEVTGPDAPPLSFGGAAPPKAAVGDVAVEVPHWATEVVALDRLMRPMSWAAPPEQVGPGRYVARLHALPVGVYTVEACLGGATVRRAALVPPDGEAALSATDSVRDDAMGREEGHAALAALGLTSAAPLDDTSTMRTEHAEAARRMSRRTTWTPTAAPSAGEPAGLFVFVRTLAPERFPDFAEGLALLDAEETVLVNLAERAVERGEGWLAFRAELTPGTYILRRTARGGSRLRHQPLHLSAGWDTQVFIAAKAVPSLQSLALDIVPRGAGYDPCDRAAAAAQVLFEAMRAGPRAPALPSVGEAVLAEVRASSARAPWLAVLAAHALRAGGAGGTSELLAGLLDGLNTSLGSHPDVLALRVAEEADGGVAAFPNPPMLRAGLRCVRERAARVVGTVPPGSLTDRVEAGIVADSPWTAWRALAPASELALPRFGELLASVLPAKAPVFRIDLSVADAPVAAVSANPVQDNLARLALVRAAQDVALAYDMGAIAGQHVAIGANSATGDLLASFDASAASVGSGLFPMVASPRIAISPQRVTENLLAPLDVSETSAALDLPPVRVEEGLTGLLRASLGAGRLVAEGGAPAWSEWQFAEQWVLGHALRRAAGQATTPAEIPEPAPPTTIEDCAKVLREEADNLREAGVETFANRFDRASRELLRRADLVALVDRKGRGSVNGALLERLQDPGLSFEGAPGFTAALRDERVRQTRANAAHRTEAPVPVEVVLNSDVESEEDGMPLGHVAILREQGAERLLPTALAAVDALLPRLSLYTSLTIHSSSEERTKYEEKLREIVGEFEKVLDVKGAKPAAPSSSAVGVN